jgi:hypothetical protein
MKKQLITLALKMSLFLFVLLTLYSCKSKKDVDQTTNSETVEYPVSLIPSFIETNLTDSGVLYPISDDFVRDFLNVANQYQGQKVQIKNTLPREWGVVMIERLPEGREIYMLQSKSREWIYLAITSGMGTQRILDVLPVAVNLALQNQDILESEVWKTARNEDGSFTIEKTYNWVRSVATATKQEVESNPEAFTKTGVVNEIFTLNNMSRFEFIQSDNIPEYSAVIFYYTPGHKPLAWDETIPILQSFCEDNEIIFDELYENFDKVIIRDYKLNDITELNLASTIGISPAGMVLLKKDLEPKNVNFASMERMQIEIKRYFKIISQ